MFYLGSSQSCNKFLCALKVVDSSLYSQKDLDKVTKLSYATIVVAAERIEDMPIIRKIGDIVSLFLSLWMIFYACRDLYSATKFKNTQFVLTLPPIDPYSKCFNESERWSKAVRS